MSKVKSDRITVFDVTSSDLSSTHRLKPVLQLYYATMAIIATMGVTECYVNIFFIVVDSSKSNFFNMLKLFLGHPCLNLDSTLFESKTNETTIVSNTETKYGSHKEESSPKLLENDCPVEDVNTHIDFQLPLWQTELKIAKINLRATLKELYDLSYLMKDIENGKNHTKTINLMVKAN